MVKIDSHVRTSAEHAVVSMKTMNDTWSVLVARKPRSFVQSLARGRVLGLGVIGSVVAHVYQKRSWKLLRRAMSELHEDPSARNIFVPLLSTVLYEAHTYKTDLMKMAKIVLVVLFFCAMAATTTFFILASVPVEFGSLVNIVVTGVFVCLLYLVRAVVDTYGFSMEDDMKARLSGLNLQVSLVSSAWVSAFVDSPYLCDVVVAYSKKDDAMSYHGIDVFVRSPQQSFDATCRRLLNAAGLDKAVHYGALTAAPGNKKQGKYLPYCSYILCDDFNAVGALRQRRDVLYCEVYWTTVQYASQELDKTHTDPARLDS